MDSTRRAGSTVCGDGLPSTKLYFSVVASLVGGGPLSRVGTAADGDNMLGVGEGIGGTFGACCRNVRGSEVVMIRAIC